MKFSLGRKIFWLFFLAQLFSEILFLIFFTLMQSFSAYWKKHFWFDSLRTNVSELQTRTTIENWTQKIKLALPILLFFRIFAQNVWKKCPDDTLNWRQSHIQFFWVFFVVVEFCVKKKIVEENQKWFFWILSRKQKIFLTFLFWFSHQACVTWNFLEHCSISRNQNVMFIVVLIKKSTKLKTIIVND